ncbi:APC family permease [Geodermatophilus sp. YIM 151500]|uniref:APC family permease n=1 Tax=Geodermatophilus sp. YIM 151500 TaxID=2984531 RepID=UPI0021E50179|nr:APC family permease [Geodermatophilus sp. YIM 151500]MCV2491194.1 APC family permease [Geodermatophilus sp. YIM 151500]
MSDPARPTGAGAGAGTGSDTSSGGDTSTGGDAAKDADTNGDTDGDTRLKRAVSVRLLYLFILGDVLGAGIYALVGEVAAEVGGALWVPLVVALGLALLTAASYAELVGKYPRAGGAAVYAEKAFRRPEVSFLVGFCMLAAGVTSAAGLTLAFAGDYLAVFVEAPTTVTAVVFLVALALVNARGISESVRANVVMTVVEVSGLLLVVVLGAVVLGRGDGDLGRVIDFPDGVPAGSAVLAAALIAYYSFVGFEVSANIAEEVHSPARAYPRALFGALATAGVVYLLVALAAAAVVPADTLAGSSGPLLEVVRAAGAGVPGWLFSAVALTAVANGALLAMIMSSRLVFGMAEQGLLPRSLGRVLPGRRTPWVAIVVTTAVAIALTLTGTLADLATTVVLLLLLVFLSVNTAVLVLKRDTVDHRHFVTPRAVPVLAIGSCVLLLWQQEAGTWLRAGILLAVGVLLYLLTRPARRRGEPLDDDRPGEAAAAR